MQDDALTFDACTAFNGGMRSALRPNLLQATEFASGKNCDIDRYGDLVTRRGSSKLGSALPAVVRGLGYLDTPSVEMLVAASNGAMYKYTGTIWTLVSGYSPNPSNRVEMTQLIDKLYLTDSVGNVFSFDGTTFTDLGSGATAAPKCKILVSHTGRLFAAGTSVPDELRASDILNAGHWDGSNFSLRVGKGDGDPIKALCPWEGTQIVVGKEHSIYVVDADPTQSTAANWNVSAVDYNVGCVAHRTMKAFGKDVWFLSRAGVHTIQKLYQQSQFQVMDPVSAPIRDVIERINWDYVDMSCAMVWNNRYILAVPLDTSTYPDTVLVYNSLTQSWAPPWTGWQATVFCMSIFSGSFRMNFGQNDGRVLQWRDYTPEALEATSDFQDDSVDIPTEVITRAMNFGDVVSEKISRYVELEFFKSSCVATVQVILDSDSSKQVFNDTINTSQPGLVFPIQFPLTWPLSRPLRRAENIYARGRFSEIQVKVSSSSKKMRLRTVKCAAYTQTVKMKK